MSESAEGLAADLAEKEEGFSATPYRDAGGVWTYGYGSTRDQTGQPVTADTPPISREDADKLVQRDMASAFDAVRGDVKVPLTPEEEAALADFTYNLGMGNLKNSTLLKMLNAGDLAGAEQQFAVWDTVNGRVLAGLVRRRAEEAALFQQGMAASGDSNRVANTTGTDAAYAQASAQLQAAQPAASG